MLQSTGPEVGLFRSHWQPSTRKLKASRDSGETANRGSGLPFSCFNAFRAASSSPVVTVRVSVCECAYTCCDDDDNFQDESRPGIFFSNSPRSIMILLLSSPKSLTQTGAALQHWHWHCYGRWPLLCHHTGGLDRLVLSRSHRMWRCSQFEHGAAPVSAAYLDEVNLADEDVMTTAAARPL